MSSRTEERAEANANQRNMHAADSVRRRDQRVFQWTARVALVVAATSAAVFALLDAATVASRMSGESVEARPVWLHTFSIAVLTCAVAAHAIWFDTTVGATTIRLACLVTAAANVTVLALGLRHDELHRAVPAVHLGLAVLLTAMALLARRSVAGRPLGNTGSRPPPATSDGLHPPVHRRPSGECDSPGAHPPAG